jgi:hypothetical protein
MYGLVDYYYIYFFILGLLRFLHLFGELLYHIKDIYIIIIRCYDKKKKKKFIASWLEFPTASYDHHTMFSPTIVGGDESIISDENIKDCVRTLIDP